MKTCVFITLGCKVNQYETQAIRESLAAKGFIEVEPEQAADLYIINTCTVTSVSDEKYRYLTLPLRDQVSHSFSLLGKDILLNSYYEEIF